jgi:hypothetical protein
MAEEPLVQEVVNEVVADVVTTTRASNGVAILLVGGACICAAVGGYFFAMRRLETKYKKIADDEIADMKAHYRAKEQELDEKKAEKAPLDEVMREHGYTTKMEGPDETVWVKVDPSVEDDEDSVADIPDSSGVSEVQNVFYNAEAWDYKVELANRSEDVPYVIHRDEYFGEETPFEQITLTYYEGDDVLADSHDTPIDDQDAMVCLGNLAKFGHGSGDPNIVYVRNHELELEIEIVHSDGKFAEEVHGFSDDELRHSDRRHRRKLDDDEI